jgi:hypothetical protein
VSAGLVIVIVVAAVVVLGLLATMLMRARAEREIERRRVVGEWGAHREAAATGHARAQALGAEAAGHREAAAEHASLADEHAEAASEHAEQAAQLERQIADAGDATARHETAAEEREERLR